MAMPPAPSPRKGGGITLDDVDASLEPVAPEELDEDFAAEVEGAPQPHRASALEEGGIATYLRRSDSLELLPSAAAADQPRAHPDGVTPRAAPPSLDPWLNDRRAMTWREAAAAALLVPPRVALCLALAAALMPLSVALMMLHATMPEPWRRLAKVRAVVVLPVRLLCRIALLGAGFWRIPTRGAFEPGRGGAHLVVANHCSVGDVLYAVYALAPAFLAKAEATRIPYIGAAASALGCVLVDRRSAESRAAARAAIAERAATCDPEAPPLLIFPEGTTTNGLCLITWERGAFAPARPVVPMAIAYPKGQPKPDALFSIETLRAIARPRNRMRVVCLRPHVPDVEEVRDAGAFAAHVRAEVAAVLGLPVSPLSYRDGLHRRRREAPASATSAAASALRAALPPLPFRERC